jgi:prophage regulatory protein
MPKNKSDQSDDAPRYFPRVMNRRREADVNMRIVLARDLPRFGITLSASQIAKMVARGDFPRPFKVVGRLNAWTIEEVDAWIDARIEKGRRDNVDS